MRSLFYVPRRTLTLSCSHVRLWPAAKESNLSVHYRSDVTQRRVWPTLVLDTEAREGTRWHAKGVTLGKETGEWGRKRERKRDSGRRDKVVRKERSVERKTTTERRQGGEDYFRVARARTRVPAFRRERIAVVYPRCKMRRECFPSPYTKIVGRKLVHARAHTLTRIVKRHAKAWLRSGSGVVLYNATAPAAYAVYRCRSTRTSTT